MPIKVKTFTQRFFDRAGVKTETPTIGQTDDPHAVSELYNLKPDPHTGLLRRGPAWVEAGALPADFTEIAGAFYDEADGRYCIIGENAAGDMQLTYTTDWATWNAPQTIVSGKTLGGLSHRNVLFWGGYLWVIDEDGDVHRNVDYDRALVSFYAGSDAVIISPMNDRCFGATDTGTILRQTVVPDFGNYHDPAGVLNVIYIAPFRQYLTVIAKGDDDTLAAFRLPDYAAHGLHQLARIPTPGYNSGSGCPVALFDDRIWILTDQQQAYSQVEFDVYAFDGAKTRRAAVIDYQNVDDTTHSGFFVWNNNLIFYCLENTNKSSHQFYLLVGNSFQPYAFLGTTGGNGVITPFAAALGDVMICTGIDADDNEVLYYAQRDSLEDGHMITPRLDFGYLTQKKRLHSITVLNSDRCADFKTVIKYRTDNNTNWTTAVTGNNSLLTTTADLKTEFTILQVRVDLDDDSVEQNQDYGLASLAIRYSVND